jgi:tetratricopeptide (TPR) repeat protein
MSYYVLGSRLSYLDYLQAKSFEDSFKGEISRQTRGFENSFKSEISKQTRSIIGSNEELRGRFVSGIEELSDGLERLSFDVRELTATFQWGFSELLTAVGQVNDSLRELVKTAKTPAQTWAYEQFEGARDAFRQGLYQEALEYLDRAINGYAGNTGHKLEYRFHYLKGTIRLGSFQNTSKEIVDLNQAENAFVNASRYARHDHPAEAARALLAAGWAAYCQGKIPEATQYSQQAISLMPEFAEAYFQLAKIQMHAGAPESALPNLERAIQLDRAYSIKAAGDGDFMRYEGRVKALIESLRQRAKKEVESLIPTTEREAAETEKRRVREFSLPNYAELTSAKRALREASSAAQRNTFFGYLDALSFCIEARKQMQAAIAQFVERAEAEANRKIAELDSRISEVRSSEMSGGWSTVALIGIIIFFILGCQQCSRVSAANDQQKQIRLNQLNSIKSKGYDLNRVTVQQAETILGEPLAPWDTGRSSFGAWFLYAIVGSAMSVVVAVIGNRSRKRSAVADLDREKQRLQQTRSEIQKIHRRPAAEFS